MNILDWITDLVVTAWELIGLMFRSGISEAVILEEEQIAGSTGPRSSAPTRGARRAQFA
jgi:hypothetical protein